MTWGGHVGGVACREEDRLKRIADEGWDRFAPVSEDNKPPGGIPSGHPSVKGSEK
jgi:hypothetical protein